MPHDHQRVSLVCDVLFVTMDGGGNVPPILSVAARVAGRGHRVRIVGHPSLRDDVTRVGLPFEPFRTARCWDSSQTRNPLSWLPMLNDAHIAEEIRQLCATERPSVAVVDCMLLPALSAVQESGIPHAVLSHTFRGYLNGMHRLGVGSAARIYGYRISELWNAADLNLVTTVAWLDPESRRPQPDNVRWIGAAVSGREPRRRQDPPLVLVSMSTNGFRGQRRTVERIINALATLPVRAIVTTGEMIDPARLPAAPNVDVLGYTDHGQLMQRCSLLIGHGGHSTTFRALAHSLPALLIPAHPFTDQPLVASSIARAGAAIALRRSASVSTLRAAISALLTEPRWPEAAARIGTQLRTTDAAGQAADLIIALAKRDRSA